MFRFSKKVKIKGFTLIEIMIVVVLIGILAAIILASVSSAREKSKIARAEEELKSIKGAFKLYLTNTGSMPPGTEHCSFCGWGGWSNPLSASVQDDWLDVVTELTGSAARLPEYDPWGRYYAYDNNFIVEGTSFPSVVCSLGRDGVLQTWRTATYESESEVLKTAEGDDVCIFFTELDDGPSS